MLKKVNSFFRRYGKARPKPERNLDQFLATEKTVLKRVEILGNLDNINQKTLLFLGDDDLISLVFSLFFKAKKIMVVDIDKRQLNFIAEVARQENFDIEIFEHDLRNSLPKEDFKDYDVVFFDPPYTPAGVAVWLERTIETTLGSGGNKDRKDPRTLSQKQYFMCYGYTDQSTERGLLIQKIITSFGLVIEEKMRKFNRYYGAASIGSASDLYILKPTPKVNLRKFDVKRSQFYTGQKTFDHR